MPRFEHNCSHCQFIGEHDLGVNRKCDWYFCANFQGGDVIARRGNKPEDYAAFSLYSLLRGDGLTDLGRKAKEVIAEALDLSHVKLKQNTGG